MGVCPCSKGTCPGDSLLERAVASVQGAHLQTVPRVAAIWGGLRACRADHRCPVPAGRRRSNRLLRCTFSLTCALLVRLGEARLLAGRLEEAQALAERALALACAQQERGIEAYPLWLLGEIAARRSPSEARRLKATTARPSPWLRSWACAHSRPTATAASALYMGAGALRACPHRPVDGHRVVPRHGDDLLAAPDRGGARAGGSRLSATSGVKRTASTRAYRVSAEESG